VQPGRERVLLGLLILVGEARKALLAPTAALFAAKVIESGRSCDLAEPSALGAAGGVEAVPEPDGALERLGRKILSGLRVAREVEDVAVDVVEMPSGGVGERARHLGHTSHIRRARRIRHTLGATR